MKDVQQNARRQPACAFRFSIPRTSGTSGLVPDCQAWLNSSRAPAQFYPRLLRMQVAGANLSGQPHHTVTKYKLSLHHPSTACTIQEFLVLYMPRAHLTAPHQKTRHAGLLQAAGQTLVRRQNTRTRPANCPRSSTGLLHPSNTPHHIPHHPSLRKKSQSSQVKAVTVTVTPLPRQRHPLAQTHNTVQVACPVCACNAYCHMQVSLLCHMRTANMSQLPRPTRTPKSRATLAMQQPRLEPLPPPQRQGGTPKQTL